MEAVKQLRLETTGRMKTVGAIVEKLNRQRIRLTQIQNWKTWRQRLSAQPATRVVIAR